tara:strand:- start:38 stop:613 length:576 start_codon:yes stop_codon:yes gene_type:complete
MSLKDLSNNLQTEGEFHTFTKQERVIRRPLGISVSKRLELHTLISKHKHEEARKTNVKAWMTNWYLHKDNPLVNDICLKAIDIVKSVTMQDQKGKFEKFFTFDCWGAIYEEHQYTKPHTHGPALWSWVYYIQVPKNSPPLYFPQAKLNVFPKSDELVMFPGQVIHEVPKASEMDAERVVLAGNIYLDYRNS